MKQYKTHISLLFVLSLVSVIYLVVTHQYFEADQDLLTLSALDDQMQSFKEEVMINILSSIKSLFQNNF